MDSYLGKAWAKAGIDYGSFRIMVKGALPATLALAFYQIDFFAKEYNTQGFLVSVIAVLALAFLPRGKFVQIVTFEIIAVSLAAVVNMFTLQTAIIARSRSIESNELLSEYNPTGSAICGIWLFFQQYVVNSLRSAYQPASQLPTVLYSIYANISMVYGPHFVNESEVISFIYKTWRSFVTAFVLAIVVNLCIMPNTSREAVFADMTSYIGNIGEILKHQDAAVENLQISNGVSERKKQSPKAFRTSIDRLKVIDSRLSANVDPIFRELAWGKMRPRDISRIINLLNHVSLPLYGMASLLDLAEKAVSSELPIEDPQIDRQQTDSSGQRNGWSEIMETLQEPVRELAETVSAATTHVAYRLELWRPPKEEWLLDEEELVSGSGLPGTDEFTTWYDKRMARFYKFQVETVNSLLKKNGEGEPNNNESHNISECRIFRETSSSQAQLHFNTLLSFDHLITQTIEAVGHLLSFTEAMYMGGAIRYNQIIAPDFKRSKQWLKEIFIASEASKDAQHTRMAALDSSNFYYLGQAYKAHRHPEYLPPQNAWEEVGTKLHIIPDTLRSVHSAFGFRVACANISIALMAYLPTTYKFFIRERLVWALILGTASFTRTSGQSAFNFFHRILGTFVGMVASLFIYYVVAGNAAGIIILTFIWICICNYYGFVKKPDHILSAILAAVTPLLVCGYQLQVQKIGIPEAERNSQTYYPTYQLAPYRLAAVSGGLAVAFLWEIFPYPLSDRKEIRQGLSSALYLLSNYHAIVHETVRCSISHSSNVEAQMEGLIKLAEKRDRVFTQERMLLSQARGALGFTKWEFVGGKFPRDAYSACISRIESIMLFGSITASCAETFEPGIDKRTVHHTNNRPDLEGPAGSEWQTEFRQAFSQVIPSAWQEITRRLCLLAASLSSGNPLPPFLDPLVPLTTTDSIKAAKPHLLSPKHATKPGYAAFATMQVCMICIVDDVNRLTELTKELVGELDFHFETSTSAGDSNNNREELD